AMGTDNTIELWELGQGQITGQRLSGGIEKVISVAFNPFDSTVILIACEDKTVQLWTTNPSGGETWELGRAEYPNITSAAFSPTNYGGLLYEFATAGRDGIIQVWTFKRGSGYANISQCTWCRY
ncbi:MAG TPA: hypothetical protein VEC96_12205, partial [Anaerolineae bacterium]|nr:hypothetical protein [Anaerolineae bacterium]